MNHLESERHLKVIIIDPEGNVFPYYVDNFDLEHNDISHFEVFESIGKKEKNVSKKLLREVRKAAHAHLYLDIIRAFHNFNYSIFLDTTNYNNYHIQKLHTGKWLMPHEFFKLPLLQQRSFIQLSQIMPEAIIKSEVKGIIPYDEISVEYLNKGKIICTDRNGYLGIFKNEKKMK